jgi:hypothetical protein
MIMRVMQWKRLTVLSALVLFAFTLTVGWSERNGGPCYKQRHRQEAGDPSYPCNVISSANLPTDYLVIVGICGAFIAISTLKSIHHSAVQVRKQTELLKESANAAKDAADAAKESADALINIERAWIEVYLQLGPTPHVVTHQSAGENQTSVSLEFNCTNFGKTPAWVITKQIGMILLPEAIAAPNELPDTRAFPLIGHELVAAGKEMIHTGIVHCDGRITKGQPAPSLIWISSRKEGLPPLGIGSRKAENWNACPSFTQPTTDIPKSLRS